MTRLRERIPQERFDDIFRPMIRALGTRTVILRINEVGRTAIPRQTKLDALMPKLAQAVFEQARPKLDEELDRLWNLYFDSLLQEREVAEPFSEASERLNKSLQQDKVPTDEEGRALTRTAIEDIVKLLAERDFSPSEIEGAFRIKAFPEVLQLFLESRPETPPPA